jgi:hypothetical protein
VDGSGLRSEPERVLLRARDPGADATLKALVAGKTLTVKNTVTGDSYQILYGTNGTRLVLSINGRQPEPAEAGGVLHGGEVGGVIKYEIANGRIVTTLATMRSS